MAGREADEVTWRQDPLPRGFAKHRCARDYKKPGRGVFGVATGFGASDAVAILFVVTGLKGT
jgi:hypothetical protein